ncbi:MAG: hypothetical protein IH586_05185, partial [Anaerolineaceae bacterium]|nr:hypothetical protein [Anaerolineaceae bacterium]
YHAEAEWAGAYEPFERAVRIMAEDQIDCDVVPMDVLVDAGQTAITKGRFAIQRESYRALVVPFAEYLPQSLLKVLVEMIQHNVPVIFTGELPVSGSQNGGGFEVLLEELRASPNTAICEFDLVEHLRYLGVTEIETVDPEPTLRVLHYVQEKTPLYFFTNESRTRTVRTKVTLRESGAPVGYDPLANELFGLVYTAEKGKTTITLEIEPYESLFVVFQAEGARQWSERLRPARLARASAVDSAWQVSSADGPEGAFKPEPGVTGPGNVARPGLLPRFSGTLRYETTLKIGAGEASGPALLDLGEVYEIAEVTLNGKNLGARICPPYRFDVTGLLHEGANMLTVDVTNTLAKAWGSQNPFDRSMPQEPSGLIGPVRLLRE